MKIAFRVDASLHIGTGHIMRCLTLAEELKSKGNHVLFICREHSGNLCNLIVSRGFEVFSLRREQDTGVECSPKTENVFNKPPLVHASWLGIEQENDADQTLAVLQADAPWDWLIVDHYALDYRWESNMRKVADKIMVIDDLADRKHDCNLLLDQNYFHCPDDRYSDLVPGNCEMLLSPRYALLRPEFRKARKFCRMRGNGLARILIYFGGNDPDNLTGMTLGALNCPDLSHLLVDVVIGFSNPHQKELEALVKQRPGIRLHIQPEGFIELMVRADLFIGAGGTTTWERLCLGLHSLVITVAKNQDAFTRELDRAIYIKWLGRKEQVKADNIVESVIRFSNEGFIIPNELVDGRGVDRVVKSIVKYSTHSVNQ